MRFNLPKVCLKFAATVATVLLCGTMLVQAQQTVNLTAKSTSAALSDGQSVPMWGYACNDAGTNGATCAASNPKALGNWSPVTITATPGSLTINLTNSLPSPVPTSLVIVGQVGGGLGDTPSRVDSPVHGAQGTTWPIADPGTTYTPPTQPKRVQSFATEVTTGATTTLTWTSLKPGTYLIESGTHPSIQGPMGLYGVLVVTTPPSGTTLGTAYPGVTYNADVPLLLSEIDPVQNAAVAKAVTLPDFSETTVWSGQPGGCGNPDTVNSGNCYPPAVNYSPLYYLVNGVSLDRANVANSMFSATPSGTQTSPLTGKVLVRFVNAGLRMHVPSIVGATTGTATPAAGGFSLIAEDGNVLPGNPRVQSEVFLAAGKTYDVMINAALGALPVFDRQLSLSANNQRDGGMQAYVSANGALPPAPSQATTVAVADSYVVLPGTPLTISDPARGLIANDMNVYGVQVVTPPTHGSLALSPDGTFTYTPAAGWAPDSFIYQANGNPLITATVSLNSCAGTCVGGAPTAGNSSYTSNIATRFQIGAPGVLLNSSDPQGHPLTAFQVTGVTNGTVTLNPDGSFVATPATPPTGVATSIVTFTYSVKNSQGTTSATGADGTVKVTFMGGSGLQVNVLDAPVGVAGTSGKAITDYRWIIEEDRTFQVDPTVVNGGTTTVQSLGTNFHTSYMPVVAAGCVGQWACEYGQTVYDPASKAHLPATCDIGDGLCRTTGTGVGQQVPVDPMFVHLDPNKHYYISILPGDAGNDFTNGGGAPVPIDPSNPNGPTRQFDILKDCGAYTGPSGNWAPGSGMCGHGMGGAQIKPAQTAVNVLLQETPFQPAKISLSVYEDDFPLNGENDASGGVDVLAPNEPGLGGFEIRLWDAAGGTGDATGQMTYDMFNMPLTNSLAGTPDPMHPGNDACPITANAGWSDCRTNRHLPQV